MGGIKRQWLFWPLSPVMSEKLSEALIYPCLKPSSFHPMFLQCSPSIPPVAFRCSDHLKEKRKGDHIQENSTNPNISLLLLTSYPWNDEASLSMSGGHALVLL